MIIILRFARAGTARGHRRVVGLREYSSLDEIDVRFMPSIDQYLTSERERFEEELCQWLRIPSVSADSSRREDMARAAEWVASQLRGLGFATEVIPSSGPPLVYAESPCQRRADGPRLWPL